MLEAFMLLRGPKAPRRRAARFVRLLVWILLVFVTLFLLSEISLVLISNTDVSSRSAMRGSDRWDSMLEAKGWLPGVQQQGSDLQESQTPLR